MDCLFEKEVMILPGVTDASAKLSYHGTFSMFMDVASEHAERLGIGTQLIRRGLFWLTVKTQIRFFKRPGLGKLVTLSTWPETPERMRCCRSYQLRQEDSVLISGKTEWAVVSTETGRLTPLEGVFPAELDFSRLSACPEPFARIGEKEFDETRTFEHVVRSTDVDLGGHMNNAAYVRAIMDTFSVEEQARLRVRRMDVLFRSPCFEGNRLLISKRGVENGMELRVVNGDKTAVLARMELDSAGA